MASCDIHIKLIISEEDRAILNYLSKIEERKELDRSSVSYIMTGPIMPEAAKGLRGIRTPFRPEQEDAPTNAHVFSRQLAEEQHDRASRD